MSDFYNSVNRALCFLDTLRTGAGQAGEGWVIW